MEYLKINYIVSQLFANAESTQQRNIRKFSGILKNQKIVLSSTYTQSFSHLFTNW